MKTKTHQAQALSTRKILHDIEVIIRDFFALHWDMIEMPFVMVAVNIMFLIFIAITR